MVQSRRGFLRTFTGAGVALLSLPTVSTLNPSSWFELDGLFGGPDGKTVLDLTASAGNPFVALAGGRQPVLLKPQRLLSTPRALLNILERLELPLTFSNRVNYDEAAQCRGNFQTQEAAWRSKFASFTDVQRSPVDPDVAYLVGGNIESGRYLGEAEGSTQYQGNGAQPLAGNAPVVIDVSQVALDDDGSLSRKERAQSLAVIDKRPKTIQGLEATQYVTPTTQVTYIPNGILPDSDVGRRSLGVVKVENTKYNTGRAYLFDLYA